MHTVIAILLFATTTFATDAGLHSPRVRDVIKKEYAVSPGGTLHVDLDRGNIEVEITDEDRVYIALERVAKAEDKDAISNILRMHEYAFDKRDNDVYVHSRFRPERAPWRVRRRPSLKVTVFVRVPTEYNVRFTNGAGNVEVFDVRGLVRGRTGAGNIIIGDVEGEVRISSGAGNIEVDGDINQATLRTGAGNIEVYGLRGAVSANSGAGNIEAIIVEQPEGDSRFSTGAGNITVALADDIGVYVDATASLGSAKCEFPLTVSKKFLSKSFAGNINGGGAHIEMRAGVGNVALKRHQTQ